jgi:hypothetical protein
MLPKYSMILKKSVGIDPGFGSSKFAIVITQYVTIFSNLCPKQSCTLDLYQDLFPYSIGLLFDDDGNIKDTCLVLSNTQEGH